METKRQLQVASLVKREMANLFIREGFNLYGKALVTVSQVNVLSDLSIVRIYVSIYNTDDPAAVEQCLNDKNKQIRYKLGTLIKNQVRKIPELEFYRDDTLDQVFELEDILKDIKKSKDKDK